MRSLPDNKKSGEPLVHKVITDRELVSLLLSNARQTFPLSGYKLEEDRNFKGYFLIIGPDNKRCGFIRKLPKGGYDSSFRPNTKGNNFF